MSRVGAQSPGNAAGDSELREIHQKMSRKIAQLTKVIYTLNTKNEDSEAKIKHLGNRRKEIIKCNLVPLLPRLLSKFCKILEK